jgi:hypothetical protein
VAFVALGKDFGAGGKGAHGLAAAVRIAKMDRVQVRVALAL